MAVNLEELIIGMFWLLIILSDTLGVGLVDLTWELGHGTLVINNVTSTKRWSLSLSGVNYIFRLCLYGDSMWR